MKAALRTLSTLRVVTLFMFVAAIYIVFRVQRVAHKNLELRLINATAPQLLHGQEALDEVKEFLTISPRVSGTTNGKKAAEYIKTKLQEFNLDSSIDLFSESTPAGEVVFRNVEAVIPGIPGKTTVVLLSHYDTKSGMSDKFTGANDSGSSTGLLLELAEVLSRNSRYPFDIMLAFVDGEECVKKYSKDDGLHGSRRLVKKLRESGISKEIKAVVVLDMIGDKNLGVTVPSNCSPELISLLFESARQLGYRDKFSLLRRPMIDDHKPFIDRGIPALDIIDFEYGLKDGGNQYWHTEEDSIDKLSAESLEITGRVLINMLNNMAGLPQ